MAGMLEASTARRKYLRVETGLCRQVPAIRYPGSRRRCDNAICQTDPLGVEPGDFPQPLRRPPDGAEALGALAQVGFLIRDAHGNNFVVAAPRQARLGTPGAGRDDKFNGGVAPACFGVVQVAHADQPVAKPCGELARALLPGAQGGSRLDRLSNGRSDDALTPGPPAASRQGRRRRSSRSALPCRGNPDRSPARDKRCPSPFPASVAKGHPM